MPEDNQATGTAAPDDSTASDNATTQPSEASEQQQEAPEATQEQATAEEAVAPETKVEDKADEKLIAGKFKSVEDLERGYKELESKFGATNSEKVELAKMLNETFTPPAQQEVEADTEDYVDYGINPVNQEIEDLKRKSAVQTFILSHDDADPATMQEVLTSDPLVQQISSHEAKLEYAYLKSQGMTQKQAIADAEKKGAERTQVKMAEKSVAQVESSKTAAAPVNNKAELLERMRYGDRTARAEVISNLDAVKEMRRMAGYE